jgi:LDH2 family malate/lactate/ureidoglycolate dehydrogenase
MLVMDLRKMMDPMEFASRLEEYTEAIVNAPKAVGADKIFYPGEPNWIQYDKAVREGLSLPEDTEKAARQLAELSSLDLNSCVM